MKPAKIAVLGIAVAAGGAAAYLASAPQETPAPVEKVVSAPVTSTEVLVVGADVPIGRTLKSGDIKWQQWPAEMLPTGAIARKDQPNAAEQLVGTIARANLVSGEPLRREKLIKADGSGFMAAVLPQGMRAVAINIDTRGSSSAGGFVMPNDRVDIIRTYRDEEASKTQGTDVYVSETILFGVRVLAIGQSIQERGAGDRGVTGETATLELDARQAELVTWSQKIGQLSLVLRSLADADQKEGAKPDKVESGMSVVRYGVSKPSR